MRVFASLVIGAALCAVGCEQRDSSSSTSGDGGPRGRVVLEVRPPAENGELFVATQAELIKGDAVLAAAVEALDLESKWEQADASATVDKLAPMVTAARVGESSLIELVVTAGDETESVEIANAVAKAFVEWSSDEEEARLAKRREQLQQRIDEQKEKLEKARVKMLDVMEQHSVVDLSQPGMVRPETMTMSPMRGEFKPEQHVEDLKTTIATLEGLEGDELIAAAADLSIAGPAIVNRSYDDFQDLLVDRSELQASGLGDRHPSVVQINNQLTDIRGELEAAVAIAKGALATQLEMAEQALKNAASANEDDAGAPRQYLESRDDYELERGKLEALATEAERSIPAEVRITP